MNTRLFLAIVFLLIVPLCLHAQPAKSAAREKAEYPVYSALIADMYVRNGRRLMVIANPAGWGDAAVSLGYSKYPYQQSAPVSQDVFEDFRNRNADHLALKRKINLAIPYVIAERTDLVRLVSGPDNDWSGLLAKYSNSPGFVLLSRIGFNHNRDQAFVFSCEIYDRAFQPCRFALTTKNPGCEACWFISLSRKKGGWKVTNSVFHSVYPT